jgi:5-methylthioribose kinase
MIGTSVDPLVLRLAAPHLPVGELTMDEIGDGNLNFVYRVRNGDASVIVKQAPPYLRAAGFGWPLTQDRIRIEAEALRSHGELAPGQVPRLLAVDPEGAALVLEDLREHVVWRTALIEGRHVPGAADLLGRYCARTLLGTCELLADPRQRTEMLAGFVNPELCAITEELVFTAPYLDAPSNNYDEATADLAASLRADLPLRRCAAQLLWEFRTRREALIHGDLHTGSVLVAAGDARAFDLEFAFFGPMAYDTGNVVANLAFAAIAHDEQQHDQFVAQIGDYATEFWAALRDEARLLWPHRQPWNEIFLSALLEDTARYAATELVRRTVGLAHVADIDSLDPAPRLRARQRAVAGARSLALGPAVRSITDLWTRATTEETRA